MSTTQNKHRRKVREVSSRYLSSPSTSFSSSINTHFPSNSSNPEKDQFDDENLVVGDSESNVSERQRRPLTPMAVDSPLIRSSRNPLRLMNFEMVEGIGLVPNSLMRTSVRCSTEWGSERKGMDGSLCRASVNFCRKSLKLGSSLHVPLELDKEVSRPFSSLKPPKPQNVKVEMKMGKESKVLKRQEDVHLLRLLENRYLQWRFVSAEAQVADRARRIAAEESLHKVSCKMAELRYSVMMERIEIEQLKREKRLAMIVEAQMPLLNEWSSVEGDYSSSLSGTTKALLDASSRLPIIGNVKADVNELNEILDTAVNMMECSSSCVENYLTKAEGMENIILELKKSVSREKVLIEECTDLSLVVHEMQVKECSLRGQVIQVKQSMTS